MTGIVCLQTIIRQIGGRLDRQEGGQGPVDKGPGAGAMTGRPVTRPAR